MRIGRSRTSKTDNCGTNRKHRFLDTATCWLKTAYIFLPHSHSAPPLPVFPLEFRREVNREETIVMGLSSNEDRVIVAWVILTQCQRVTDRRTDGLIYYISSTALCTASYVDGWRAVKIHRMTDCTTKKKGVRAKCARTPLDIFNQWFVRHDCTTDLPRYRPCRALESTNMNWLPTLAQSTRQPICYYSQWRRARLNCSRWCLEFQPLPTCHAALRHLTTMEKLQNDAGNQRL